MKCYNHHDRDAFGVCHVCGRGLCLECLQEHLGYIICKNNSHCNGKIVLEDKAYKSFKSHNKIALFIFLVMVIVFLITLFM